MPIWYNFLNRRDFSKRPSQKLRTLIFDQFYFGGIFKMMLNTATISRAWNSMVLSIFPMSDFHFDFSPQSKVLVCEWDTKQLYRSTVIDQAIQRNNSRCSLARCATKVRARWFYCISEAPLTTPSSACLFFFLLPRPGRAIGLPGISVFAYRCVATAAKPYAAAEAVVFFPDGKSWRTIDHIYDWTVLMEPESYEGLWTAVCE